LPPVWRGCETEADFGSVAGGRRNNGGRRIWTRLFEKSVTQRSRRGVMVRGKPLVQRLRKGESVSGGRWLTKSI